MSERRPSGNPPLPKRLAARIRRAQQTVLDRRDRIACDEFNIRGSQDRLDDFYSGPSEFAAKRYGNHGVESYPVQTSIAKEAERVSYYTSRREERLAALAEAEIQLRIVEDEVLIEVSQMRKTKGRILGHES